MISYEPFKCRKITSVGSLALERQSVTQMSMDREAPRYPSQGLRVQGYKNIKFLFFFLFLSSELIVRNLKDFKINNVCRNNAGTSER